MRCTTHQNPPPRTATLERGIDCVQTIHAAQGRTADRVMIHADSRATNLVDQKMMYVAISRAKVSALVYTGDRAKLVAGIMERAREKQVAMVPSASLGSKVAKLAGAGMG